MWKVASVRILFILLCVVDDFGERHNAFILYWFCICFVKMHLTVVGGCQMFALVLFYNVFCMMSGSWKGETETYSVFYMIGENLCESLLSVATVRTLCILVCVLDDFGERHSSFI